MNDIIHSGWYHNLMGTQQHFSCGYLFYCYSMKICASINKSMGGSRLYILAPGAEGTRLPPFFWQRDEEKLAMMGSHTLVYFVSLTEATKNSRAVSNIQL